MEMVRRPLQSGARDNGDIITHTLKGDWPKAAVEPHLPLDCAQNRFHRKPDEELQPKRESEHLSRRPHPQR